MEKKYYKNIDLIRVVSCLIILFYHLNILKGGYLVVCTFFVLSGYLSVLSASNKEKFSFKEYYKNKFINLYLPVLIVSFISIALISIININWLNLKPETTSVLFGYNNYWQLNTNLDYFTRHIDSPFMHLWYIAILLQFELVFPIIYILLKKIGDKLHKFIPVFITLMLGVISYLYFYNLCDKNIMIAYYDTFARSFSLLFGMSIGFIKIYYDSFTFKNISKIIFCIYLILLIIPTFIIEASSNYFVISILIVTLISCRLIEYGSLVITDKLTVFDKFIKFLSSISYEIYLIQYPIIFILQDIKIDNYIKIIITIVLTILLSYIIHLGIKFKENKLFNWIIRLIIILISLFGLYQYVVAKDHTAEMKELEKQLNKNAEMMKLKQEEYAKQLEEEKEAWELELKKLEDGVADLDEVVHKLHLVGVGDSVMLGAVTDLYREFPKGYFDAKESRTAWVVNNILKDLKANNMLGNPVVFGLGANGDCPEWCKLEILNTIEDRNIFWLTTTWNKGDYVNKNIKDFASKHDNVYVIDWESISKGHDEYFIADGIHLTEIGRESYSKAIYDSIKEAYIDEYNNKKDAIIKARDDENKKKISFYGNDLLLNAFDYIEKEFNNAKYVMNKDFNYELLKQELKEAIDNKTLDYNIVLVFDSSFKINNDEYNELIKLCKDHNIYILSNMDFKGAISIKFDNIDNYYMADKVHLTDEGNKALSNVLKESIKVE
ncbi:MAG: acyltransferase family protein [Bacilli bacterium]|nr:acyltransferase family protein [Bacilli bacterium]